MPDFTPLSVEVYLIPAAILMTLSVLAAFVMRRLAGDPSWHPCDKCGTRETAMMLTTAMELRPELVAMALLIQALGWPVSVPQMLVRRRRDKAEHRRHSASDLRKRHGKR